MRNSGYEDPVILKPAMNGLVRPVVAALAFTVSLYAQYVSLSRASIDAAGTVPVRLSMRIAPMPPAHYALLWSGALAIRWGDQYLPASLGADGGAEIAVPPQLQTPGLHEIVLCTSETRQPLPYRAFVPVVIPTSSSLFEAEPDADRLAIAESDRIRLHSMFTGELLKSLPLASGQRVVAFTPDTRRAWLLADEAQGRLARLDLDSGAVDQELVVTPRPVAVRVPRSKPDLLLVATVDFGGPLTRVFSGSTFLPGTVRSALPSFEDDRGRTVVGNQACSLDAETGFSACKEILPGRLLWSALWKNTGFDGDFYDLTTGLRKGLFSADVVRYHAASNRAVVDGSYVIDGDTLERLAGTPAIGRQVYQVWGTDWVLASIGGGILIGRLPQLRPAPEFTAAGVSNAATGETGPIAPGEIISIYGRNLGPEESAGPVLDSMTRLSTAVENTVVLFNGDPGAILFTGPGQINVVAPESIRGASEVTVQVGRYGIPSARVRLAVDTFSPGLFAYTVAGRRYAAALTSSGTVQGPGIPLERGKPAIFFATGLGLPAGQSADSVPARATETALRPVLSIGGKQARLLYAGASPGFTAGLSQLNVLVPDDAPVGGAVEVTLEGRRSEPKVYVVIQ